MFAVLQQSANGRQEPVLVDTWERCSQVARDLARQGAKVMVRKADKALWLAYKALLAEWERIGDEAEEASLQRHGV